MRVPCGKCKWCKVALAREWALRVCHELPYHEQSLFATLTYRNEDMPPGAAISKEVAQNFLKRLRSIYAPKKIRYFLSAEYGDSSNVAQDDPHLARFLLRGFARPHYHCILFGCGLEEHELILLDPTTTEKGWKCINGPLCDAWGYGYIVVGAVTYRSARYCVKYMHKCWTKEVNERIYGNCPAPFQLQSKGLGKSYAIEYAPQILRDLSCTLQGAKVGLPRYYAKLLVTPSATQTLRSHARAADATLAARYRLETKKGITEPWQQNDAMMDELHQRGKTVLAQIKTKKGML